MSSYSGYILASSVAKDFGRADLDFQPPETRSAPQLRYIGPAFGLPRWEEYILVSPAPLADEEDGRSTYEYELLIVRGFAKLIVLGARKKIVEFAMTQILDRHIFPNLRKMAVHVDQMIEHCSHAESEFLVTSLHGRFSGPSTSLRSLSLYGDDVTQASVYGQLQALFNFHSGGLGRRLFNGLPRIRPNEEGEIVRISNDGFVFLNLSGRRRARDLIKVVNFIVLNRWVEDWVHSGQESLP